MRDEDAAMVVRYAAGSMLPYVAAAALLWAMHRPVRPDEMLALGLTFVFARFVVNTGAPVPNPNPNVTMASRYLGIAFIAVFGRLALPWLGWST